MQQSIFNTNTQQDSVSGKIVIGLERISEAFRTLLWEHAKTIGVSPMQIQILLFIAFHKEEYCNVSYLSKEFDVTKPTISDAVKALVAKRLIEKVPSTKDSRSYSILLSEEGKAVVNATSHFANPIKNSLDNLENTNLEALYAMVSKLIYGLHKSGVISVQRTCFACTFHSENGEGDFCNLLNKPLLTKDIRLDCPEFETKA
ncbi:DNA-binding MarR family transcriptional regulator [Ulvibacter sp. MAR_2010_11]|uniref:MarR family winged helix-turn-helix transcriptional regulator n=1 Tax=Ulvibacter sp. MAR_2010_11 TaxID=1250229 RepID=UPI000C2BB5DD|nr:helix-turn-helix domain-containing protein [Ulvibacter sp. MAR_2010_11]PKA84394.1 DNA-binding MarR family transcriptional regulator [Ulvibacter sp. MAR_2010_11]